MNKLFIILSATLCFIALPFSVFGQGKLDFTLVGGLDAGIPDEESSVKLTIQLGRVFFFDKNVKDTFRVFEFKMDEPGTRYQHELSYTIVATALKNKTVDDIIISRNGIWVNTFHTTYRFTFSATAGYNLQDSFNHQYLQLVALKNRKAIFYICYNAYDNTIDHKCELAVYDLVKKKIIRKTHLAYNYLFFTHFIGKPIDLSPDLNEIVFAQTIPYEVSFLDLKLKIIQNYQDSSFTLEEKFRSKLDCIKNTEEISPDHFFSNLKSNLVKIKNLDDSISRIEKVNYLSENLVMITKTAPGGNKDYRLIDVIERGKDHWHRVVKDQKYDAGVVVPGDNGKYELHVPLSSSSSIIYYKNFVLLSGQWLPIVPGETMNDFKERAGKFAENQMINRGIYVFKWTLTK